jgi:hypothetical protein
MVLASAGATSYQPSPELVLLEGASFVDQVLLGQVHDR